MSTPTLRIIQPGMLSTIQDRGRFGYQRFGMPTTGAMDTFALRAANLLVGNDDNAACIEVTVLGPRIELLADTTFAVTGAKVSPRLNGEPVPMWQPVTAQEGSRLEFRSPKDEMRAYLAVTGGIDVPLIMGSRATYMKTALGGIDGRPLQAGDILNAFNEEAPTPTTQCSFPQEAIPKYGSSHKLRVVLGPQDAAFTQAGIDTFLQETYTVSIYSDRMGYRMEGPPIEHTDGPDVISDGTPLGTIQIPGDGQPIILLADRGTTGGYTKIATVISPDLSKVAQAMPGHTVTFESVSIEEAQEAYRRQESLLDSIKNSALPRMSLVLGDAISDILGNDGKPLRVPSTTDAPSASLRGTAKVGGNKFEFDIRVSRLDD